MNLSIKCESQKSIYCPCCGSVNIVARNREASHCGNCGACVQMILVEQPAEAEASGNFEQMSMESYFQNI